ncbi:hypothetical protein [Lentilactobacillus kosonis]|uniref:Uncharacterized protein n=1 Tax=Lentilactobacillus kosonis TaxID=2810561 RepID=A0A401FJ02_9LACO|nr:hypothetical protein [Lentilactobacillus kosonis]GAY72266.1 hypothetical protein NBRC111893_412 [Lentilactobacillus kosonis]
MVKIHVNPHKTNQTVQLSDGSKGYVSKVHNQIRFEFPNHLHPEFRTDSLLTNHEVFNVHSVDGPQQFEIIFN